MGWKDRTTATHTEPRLLRSRHYFDADHELGAAYCRRCSLPILNRHHY
jgi:hypothetical protein